MNHSFFARFSKHRKTNEVLRSLDALKSSAVFRGARCDTYLPTLQPTRLIVLLGQVHTVWKGKIGNRERKNIVNCQARLCAYYEYFEQFHGVREFGGEGLYEGVETSFSDGACFQLYAEIEKKLEIQRPVPIEQIPRVAKDILGELGRRWHEAILEKSDLQKIQLYAAAVSGMTLFNFLNDEKVHVFPVEGESAYRQVLSGVNRFGEEIEKLDQTSEMRSIRQRGGKVKTQQELQVLKRYNKVVEDFNRVLTSDIRERATLELMMEKASQSPVVVFTMGVGHRKNYLRMVPSVVRGSTTAFLFVTPPELRPNLWLLIGLPVLILVVLVVINTWW